MPHACLQDASSQARTYDENPQPGARQEAGVGRDRFAGTLEEEQSKIEIIYKEPPTELKLEVGEQLLNHKKTWQELSASMKRQGYHHSKPALYRWKEHYAAGTRPRHAGGQTNLTSPQRKLVDDQAATAVVTRSAKSVKAFKRLVALAYLNSRKERGVSSLGIPKKNNATCNDLCAL